MAEDRETKMRARACIACKEKLPDEALVELEHMPCSAQDIPGRSELTEDRDITLRLCQCRACGLVQLDCESVGYYRDVIRSGGYSTTMVELRRRQYEHLIGTYGLEGKKFIEAGCGQGEFLSVLSAFPVTACGIEHRHDLVELAVGRGLTVRQGFTETVGTRLEGGPYDVFLSFNFLEHQPDPVTMLRCIRENLTVEGMGLVTVPSFEYILQYDGYYELIRDHLAYYTFDTLRYVMGLGGFEVLEEELVNRDTLSVIVRKLPDLKEAPKPRCTAADMTGLLQGKEVIEGQIRRLTERYAAGGKKLALWGAGHQGFTLASSTALRETARYIIDSAPFKQGLYAPASHIPIVPPTHYEAEPVDGILIVAPGYTEEIAGLIREHWGGDVQVLTLRSDHIERRTPDGVWEAL